MSREDVQQALRHALKLQAGRHATASTTLYDQSAKHVSGAEGGSLKPSLVEQSILQDSAKTAAASRSASTTAAPLSKQIVLSQWALDSAFSAALRVPAPRLGRPAARSVEEVTALVTDKHEKALVGNVISPQDIGVTYDMIGTLCSEWGVICSNCLLNSLLQIMIGAFRRLSLSMHALCLLSDQY